MVIQLQDADASLIRLNILSINISARILTGSWVMASFYSVYVSASSQALLSIFPTGESNQDNIFSKGLERNLLGCHI